MNKPPAPIKYDVRPGIYRHFKGHLIEVIGTARHTETEEEFVAYRHLDGGYPLWIRPAAMFFERVSRDGYVGPRFTLVQEY
jgi:hypothetical protein